MNQSMAIDDLVCYDLPINSLETDADKARWGLILRAAREHVEADAVAVLYPAWTTIRRKPAESEEPEESEKSDVQASEADDGNADDDKGPIDTLFVQLHTRDRIYWRGFEQIRDPRHQRIIGFRRIKALSTDYERDNAPSVAAWLSTLFEPLPEEGEQTDIDQELANLLEEPEVSAALYPRQMRALH